ncbi:MaoC family dehydratase [Nonomuraea sp. NPDC050783]|uniref:MaoC family dehydratase n=1 Tax=Nonomuraea sp. NPDC050783 TaxID=3154634 RepID=UPI003467827B
MTTQIARPRSYDDLAALVGDELGVSTWFDITQERIDAFADLTRDRQWIHVDPVRAAASSFGSTIGHGLMTLSLGPAMLEELISFEGFAHALNYGYERVRFPAPLPVGSRIRLRATITAVKPDEGQGIHTLVAQVFEREGHEKPVCVATQAARFFERS